MFPYCSECLEEHLLYPHMWVRLAASQLFGVLFASWSAEDLLQTARKLPSDTRTNSEEKSKRKQMKQQKHKKGKENGIDTTEVSSTNSDYLLGNLDTKVCNGE